MYERVGRCLEGRNEGGGKRFAMEDIRDIVRLAGLMNGRRRDGPHQIGRMGIRDEERNDRVRCDGGGCQERKGGGDGTTSQVVKVRFLQSIRSKADRTWIREFTDLTKSQFSIRIIAIRSDGTSKGNNLGLISSLVLGRRQLLRKITLVWLSEGKRPASLRRVFRACSLAGHPFET